MKFAITRVTTIKSVGNSPPEPFKIYEDVNEQISTLYDNLSHVSDLLKRQKFAGMGDLPVRRLQEEEQLSARGKHLQHDYR